MGSTESQNATSTKLKRISWLSQRDSGKVFHNLIHLFNEDSLRDCFNELDGKKAVGTDGISKEQYRFNLDENLRDLVSRMKRMAYKPGPVREVLIPKPGRPKEKRPLGICNFEDKIVQKMMQKVLESIYEPLFLDVSYGFRPGRGCHDAVKALRQHLFQQNVQTVIDVDLSNFFGTIDHGEMEKILREKIKDKRFIRYIIRLFKAGVLAEGDLSVSQEGLVQGSLCSPTLANIFAHYALDLWVTEVVKKHCTGTVELFRYGDDAVICCQYEKDAMRIKKALSQRLDKYKLKLNEEKTKVVSFSRRAFQKGKKQGVFDFLGFTYYWGRTRKGEPIPKVKTCGKRFRSKLTNVNEWARSVRNKYKLKTIWEMFCVKLQGHIRYFGVSFNCERVTNFVFRAVRILFNWLNRRSQRKSFSWEKFFQFIKANPLPQIKIYHSLF
jgi:group II intron reverse transcriptase/maturase